MRIRDVRAGASAMGEISTIECRILEFLLASSGGATVDLRFVRTYIQS